MGVGNWEMGKQKKQTPKMVKSLDIKIRNTEASFTFIAKDRQIIVDWTPIGTEATPKYKVIVRSLYGTEELEAVCPNRNNSINLVKRAWDNITPNQS